MRVETNPNEPWKGEELVCDCGQRFPRADHSATGDKALKRRRKQAISHHLNDCSVGHDSRRKRQIWEAENDEQREQGFKYSTLADAGFTREQAEALIEIFGS